MTKVFFLLAFALFMVFIGPIATIWSLNTLFPVLAIPYTIETWAAAFIIPAAFKTKFQKDVTQQLNAYDETIANKLARSAAGSLILTPPTAFKNTS